MSAIKQSSFSKGEVTPSLHARSDLAMYSTALKTLRNCFVMRQGGFQNRPGTTFVDEIKNSANTVRLIEWVFNADQSYVLEFGDLYMRVIADGALVESSPGVPFELATPYLEADLAELNYTQSADVMTIVHKSYAPRELTRVSETSWTIAEITYGPSIAMPANFIVSGSTGGFAKNSWWVTAINSAGEESLADLKTSNTRAAAGAVMSISWDAVTDAVEYRLYKKINPSTGLGTAFDAGLDASDLITGLLFSSPTVTSYLDDGTGVPDPNFLPPGTAARNPFSGAGNYPGAVLYSQQRRIFASSTNNPERCWGSYIGAYANFEIYQEITDSCQVQFDLVGRQVNEIMHLLETRQLLALTIGSEWSLNGNSNGGLTPTEINAKQQTYYGSKSIRPLNIGDEVYFIQARGTKVRALGFDFGSDGYKSPDLTLYSSHLFDQYTLVDWAFQQNPHSVIWVVRSDGKLLGLTSIKDQEMLAWHQHDFTDGTVENVCVIAEGSEDSLYLVIKRTIDGSVKRYIERMTTRQITDIEDAIFMDSALSYDGRNYSSLEGEGTFLTSTQITISGGTDWTHDELLTLTSTASLFVAGDVGNGFFFADPDNGQLRMIVEEYVSATVVYARPHKTVQSNLRGNATRAWAKAVDEVSGLDHLEGESVSVIGDGFVIASPNNTQSDYTDIVVASGAITLPDVRTVIHVGLPYLSDAETLDIDGAGGETLSDKAKTITGVSLHVEDTRGIWVGPRPPSDDDDDPLEDMREPALRNLEEYDQPTDLTTGVVADISIPGEANLTGRVFIRQVDPLPMTILSIVPSGYFPKAG